MIRSSGLPPRRAALSILSQVREGRPFEAALDRAVEALSAPDRRLAHELAAGVLRRQSGLDAQLAPLVSRGWNEVVPDLQDILRLGAYQLTALDRIPAHAAVDTSVALAKTTSGVRAASFVNAVLRRLARNGPVVRSASSTSSGLAAQHSHPEWLVARWIEAFGAEDTERLVQWNNTRPRLVAQPARIELDMLAELWRASGVEFVSAPYDAGLVVSGGRPAELPGYADGYFIIQDPAQALLTRFVNAFGGTIYDACAAPGGKTIALGRSAGVVAGEINPHRARRLMANVARAGRGREYVLVADARQPPIRSIDLVLLDVPCLGTGTFARHPDARWRVSPEALASIIELQGELLESTAQVVAQGGLLVYSTCSLEREENQIQVDRFLERHPEFRREPATSIPDSLLSPDGDLVILPQLHDMDGAYAARLRRSA